MLPILKEELKDTVHRIIKKLDKSKFGTTVPPIDQWPMDLSPL